MEGRTKPGYQTVMAGRTGKSCRSRRRVQSDVPFLPTVALRNWRTMGSIGSPKRSTTKPEIAVGTSVGANAAAATTSKVFWPTAARVCWSTEAWVRRPTAARVHRTSGSSGVAGTVGWSTHDAGVGTPGRTTILPTKRWWIADRTASSVKNDPLFFLDELIKVFARHPNWTMPKDQLNGTAPASPQRDGLPDMRVAFFLRSLPGSSTFKIAVANNHSTHAPTIDGR